MRYLFADELLKIAEKDKRVVLLTGDLGFHLFENLQKKLGKRFINAGVAEHNMITAAAGLAYAGFKPWVYSIAPFVTIKVLEEIRNDVAIPNLDVKIVGLGGGYDYAIAGPTHHSLGDVGSLRTIPGIKVYVPGFGEDMAATVKKIYRQSGPAYLRLTKAQKTQIKINNYAAFRRVSGGKKATIVALGSIINNIYDVKNADIWLVSELPCEIPGSFFNSIKKTKKLLVVEEHVKTGGLGEYLAEFLLAKKIRLNKFIHLSARGYVSKKYGSRDFYLRETGLDRDSITRTIKRLI